MIQINRAYSEPGPRDGVRILVDRVWPRGVSKERTRIVDWRKDLAPTTSLRKWLGHEPARWADFRRRYRSELDRSGVYSAADEEHNQAVVFQEPPDELARP